VNLPNLITSMRIGCVPLLLWILSGSHLHGWQGRQELAAAAVFLLAVLSGAVDGRLARRTRRVTPLGTLLSPLAEKLLQASAFIAMVRFAPAMLPAWMAVLIVGREFLVSGLRAVAEQEHMQLTIHDLGHGKTALQTVTVLGLLLAHAWPRWQIAGVSLSGAAVAEGVLWALLGLSVISASVYFRSFWMEALQQSRRGTTGASAAPPAGGSSGMA
jgi:CDP-diacylglycerol---glycerol-3-phosphate 3-phosphatidyltransferase